MAKILTTIKACHLCYNYETFSGRSKDYEICCAADKILSVNRENGIPIPEWCPLPDVPESPEQEKGGDK